jgi:hypothetical protein
MDQYWLSLSTEESSNSLALNSSPALKPDCSYLQEPDKSYLTRAMNRSQNGQAILA